MKTGLLITLALSFNAFSINATEIFQWKDDAGRLHFSDVPPDKVLHETKSLNIRPPKVTEWVSSNRLTVLNPDKATKGEQFLTVKSQRCSELNKKIERFERLSKERIYDADVREKKRHYRWLKQKQC